MEKIGNLHNLSIFGYYDKLLFNDLMSILEDINSHVTYGPIKRATMRELNPMGAFSDASPRIKYF